MNNWYTFYAKQWPTTSGKGTQPTVQRDIGPTKALTGRTSAYLSWGGRPCRRVLSAWYVMLLICWKYLEVKDMKLIEIATLRIVRLWTRPVGSSLLLQFWYVQSHCISEGSWKFRQTIGLIQKQGIPSPSFMLIVQLWKHDDHGHDTPSNLGRFHIIFAPFPWVFPFLSMGSPWISNSFSCPWHFSKKRCLSAQPSCADNAWKRWDSGGLVVFLWVAFLWGIPQNGWFIMEINMNDLGVPPF